VGMCHGDGAYEPHDERASDAILTCKSPQRH
jgi:hypothetical protein